MKTLRCFAILGSLMATGAVAQTPPAKPAPAPAKPAAAPAKPEGAPPEGAPPMPQPAAEMKTLQFLTGRWTCVGTLNMAGAPGPQEAKGTYVIKSDMKGFWLTGRIENPVTKQNPMGHSEQDYWTYNAKGGGFQRFAFDSFGDTSRATAAGWTGDTLQLTGNASAFGNDAPYALGITKQGDKAMTVAATIGPAEQPMIKVEYTCKK